MRWERHGGQWTDDRANIYLPLRGKVPFKASQNRYIWGTGVPLLGVSRMEKEPDNKIRHCEQVQLIHTLWQAG